MISYKITYNYKTSKVSKISKTTKFKFSKNLKTSKTLEITGFSEISVLAFLRFLRFLGFLIKLDNSIGRVLRPQQPHTFPSVRTPYRVFCEPFVSALQNTHICFLTHLNLWKTTPLFPQPL